MQLLIQLRARPAPPKTSRPATPSATASPKSASPSKTAPAAPNGSAPLNPNASHLAARRTAGGKIGIGRSYNADSESSSTRFPAPAMTELLKKAFEKASQLPIEEQDRFGAWLLEELGSEERWNELFAKSQDKLAKMAEECWPNIVLAKLFRSILTIYEVPHNAVVSRRTRVVAGKHSKASPRCISPLPSKPKSFGITIQKSSCDQARVLGTHKRRAIAPSERWTATISSGSGSASTKSTSDC